MHLQKNFSEAKLLLNDHTIMISIGGFAAFWMMALVTLHGATFGATQRNSLNEPDVPFPPACPTAENLAAICHQGQGRPRYPDSFFPASGASHFRRRGKAINRLESWYTLCCSGQVVQQVAQQVVQPEVNQILCCTQQAWKQALSQFCVEEYTTMTLAYECCEDKGDARWTCFNSELPNPNYSTKPGYTAPSVPQEEGFTFNLKAC